MGSIPSKPGPYMEVWFPQNDTKPPKKRKKEKKKKEKEKEKGKEEEKEEKEKEEEEEEEEKKKKKRERRRETRRERRRNPKKGLRPGRDSNPQLADLESDALPLDPIPRDPREIPPLHRPYFYGPDLGLSLDQIWYDLELSKSWSNICQTTGLP